VLIACMRRCKAASYNSPILPNNNVPFPQPFVHMPQHYQLVTFSSGGDNSGINTNKLGNHGSWHKAQKIHQDKLTLANPGDEFTALPCKTALRPNQALRMTLSMIHPACCCCCCCRDVLRDPPAGKHTMQ
jgi:hypothetical protein